jgi:hypothetical protein
LPGWRKKRQRNKKRDLEDDEMSISINVTGQAITAVSDGPIVQNSVNVYECSLTLDAAWNDLTPTVVFRNSTSQVTFEKAPINNKCTVPRCVLTKAGALRIGVYGTRENYVMPTLWADYIPIQEGPGCEEVYIDDCKYRELRNLIGANTQAIRAMDTAEENDIGKALMPKTVADGRVTEWEFVKPVDYSIVSKVFDTVADMAADETLEAGDNVCTKGYYAVGDDGATNYTIGSNHTGLFYVTLDNGLYANMLTEKGVIKAETIGIKKYATSTSTPDEDDMAENVTRANLALYNGMRLLFGAGHFYFDSEVLMAQKNTHVVRGIARDRTYLHFPQSNGLEFSDPIYYNYCIISDMDISANGHSIVCAEHCLTVLDSHFERLKLYSETGDCFHAPNYNVAKYVNEGGQTIYDTCVQNCVFDFINASAPTGAAFCNIMGMYTYYQHMNLVSCKYGFRNCDGIIEQINTLGTNEDYFIYYDKANSYSLRWTFINVNAESIAKAFIYTEPQQSAGSGEDPRKPETANIMAISQMVAINSGWTLKSGVNNHDIYPITVHAISDINLIQSNELIKPSAYPTRYDTSVVKGNMKFLRSNSLNHYNGGNSEIKYVWPDSQIFTIYQENYMETSLSASNIPYTNFTNRLVNEYEEIKIRKMFGGKSVDIYETTQAGLSDIVLDPNEEHRFCDVIYFKNTGSTRAMIGRWCTSKQPKYPGRIVTLINAINSSGELGIYDNKGGYGNYSNYGLHTSYGQITLKPGDCITFRCVYDVNKNNGNIIQTWLPINSIKYPNIEKQMDVSMRAAEQNSLALSYADKLPLAWKFTGYIATNGETVDVTNVITNSTTGYGYAYSVTNCEPGDQFMIVTGAGASAPRLWCFIDSSNNVLSVANANATANNTTITAPANAAKLILNSSAAAVAYKIV